MKKEIEKILDNNTEPGFGNWHLAVRDFPKVAQDVLDLFEKFLDEQKEEIINYFIAKDWFFYINDKKTVSKDIIQNIKNKLEE